jgi:4-amino-4-deoxy-L-arabinose transferase-like glycosyltransferase
LTDRRLLAVLALALAVRVLVILATPGFVPRNDAWDFDRNAVALVDRGTFATSIVTPRGGPTAYRPPLFPLALAGVDAITGTGPDSQSTRWSADRGLEAVLGTIAVALIYLIALELFGATAALVAGTIAAIYPTLLLVGSSLLSESLFIPLLLGAVLAGLKARRSARPVRLALVAGALIGLASLTRANGLLLIVPLWFLVWVDRPRMTLRSARVPAAMLAAALVALLPWTIRNVSVFHQLVPVSTEGGYTLAGQFNPQEAANKQFPYIWIPPVTDLEQAFRAEPNGNEADIDSKMSSLALSYMRHHPAVVLKTLFWNTLHLAGLPGPGLERWGAPYESYPRGLAVASVYAFWLLAVLALAGALTPAARRAPLALWGFPLAVFLSTVGLSGIERTRSPADPFLIVLGSLAVCAALQRPSLGLLEGGVAGRAR